MRRIHKSRAALTSVLMPVGCADAPFSWELEEVEVLDSGSLAIRSGPVRDSKGALIATFTSIWRLEDAGKWRIIFDEGNRACPQKP